MAIGSTLRRQYLLRKREDPRKGNKDRLVVVLRYVWQYAHTDCIGLLEFLQSRTAAFQALRVALLVRTQIAPCNKMFEITTHHLRMRRTWTAAWLFAPCVLHVGCPLSTRALVASSGSRKRCFAALELSRFVVKASLCRIEKAVLHLLKRLGGQKGEAAGHQGRQV
jgi:hypothetical protein